MMLWKQPLQIHRTWFHPWPEQRTVLSRLWCLSSIKDASKAIHKILLSSKRARAKAARQSATFHRFHTETMHATKVAAILAFCAAQGLAAPVSVLDVIRPEGYGSGSAIHRLGSLPKRTVLETTSTGDAATDAKVAQELKNAEPAIQSGMKDMASLAEDEASAMPDLLDALEAAVAPLLEMSSVMQQEAATVEKAEFKGETEANAAAAPATGATTASTDGTTTAGTVSKRDPLLGLLAPVLNTVGKIVNKRQEERELERRSRLDGIGGIVNGAGNLGAAILGLFDKRSEEIEMLEKRRGRLEGIGNIVEGVGNVGASILGLFDKRDGTYSKST
ncbi:hypothetical protein AC579_3669 [Pseudocercospora musae]|uniref:Uncharacterized protein n=1 Tax=Pseudocercospora musae TaxID=113226 RepID=A0A139IIT9_9PEZI|nr:hypothetical protein AC579_3669 [Pseudocercospora musae]